MTPVLYLHGLAGAPGLSPALQALVDAGHEVVAPVLPGFDGTAGWEAPSDYLGWLTVAWDVVDATGALPCPVIGASVGGMFAAELAVLRPEAVTRVALLAPLGMWDDTLPAEDPFAVPAPERLPMMFARGVPDAFRTMFAERGESEAAVSTFLAGVAAASLVMPLPDHGLSTRIHRVSCPVRLLWGSADRVAPIGLAKRWGLGDPTIIDGAGHLLEWDEPAAVAAELADFLRGD